MTGAAVRRQLRMGVVGIGVGASEILPAIEAADDIELVAGADVNPQTRQRFSERYPGAATYGTVADLCADPGLDAVWISSPNRYHAEHAITAARHGLHAVVDKPMAVDLEEAGRMIAAAEQSGVALLAGHTMGYSLPIRAMRRVIASGRLGRLQAIHVLSYTDWMLRPRSADELDPAQGGGVPYRQGPHQVDAVRTLGGGLLRSVRASVGQWMPERSIPGYYSAFLEFEDGTPCTIVHNGYGYFLANELVPWGGPDQHYSMAERVSVRERMRRGVRDEEVDKQAGRIGGTAGRERAGRAAGEQSWLPSDLGFVLVTCERGDIRHSQRGIRVYDDQGFHDIDLSTEAGAAPERAELRELYDHVVRGRPVVHDGAWGMATLETCLAIMRSGQDHREVVLSHQVPLPPAYDGDLSLAGAGGIRTVESLDSVMEGG